MILFLIILVVICLTFAMPLTLTNPSFPRFCYALFVSIFGVLLPLGVFLLSTFLIPAWKGDCSNGWLDCFHTGKLTLAPLVLWATGVLYVTEIKHGEISGNPGLIMGHFVGVIVAGGCFVYGFISVKPEWRVMALFLGVPLYTAIWHGIRLGMAMERARLHLRLFVFTFLGTVPFWLAGLLWSRRLFASLPEHSPSCFVVTAASHGHSQLVGPLREVSHNGYRRFANTQLITLWHFEALWRSRAPVSHKLFRRAYNRIGPLIAGHIRSPWVADFTYLALKPIEWIAHLTVHFAATTNAHTLQQ